MTKSVGQHRRRAPQREAGPDARPHPVAGHARQAGRLCIKTLGQLPQPAALVTDRQQLRRGVVAGIADTIPRLHTLDVLAHSQHDPRGAVARAKGEFPVGQFRAEQPLVGAGVDRQLGAGADGTGRRPDQDLVRAGVGQIDLTDAHLVGFDDDRLTSFHDSHPWKDATA